MAKQTTITSTIVAFLKAEDTRRIAFYEAMLSEGMDDWKAALPHCLAAVAEVTGCKLVVKERGEGKTLDANHRSYVLAKSKLDYLRTIWRGEGNARSTRGDAKTDPVEKLVAAFGELSKAEQRRFIKAIEG